MADIHIQRGEYKKSTDSIELTRTDGGVVSIDLTNVPRGNKLIWWEEK